MAKSSKKRKQRKSAQQSGAGLAKTAPQGDVREPPKNLGYARAARASENMPALHFGLGILFLLVAVGNSFMLVLDHIGGISLPGCGEGSSCAEAAASVWGSVPVIGWPTAFLGSAYFAGALVAWLLSRRSFTPMFQNVVRFGALISLGFMLVIVFEGHLCWYCIAAHAGNFAFWIVTEITRKKPGTSWRPAIALALVFIVSSSALGFTKWREEKIEDQRQEGDLASSTDAIIAADARKAARAAEMAAEGSTQPATSTDATDKPDEASHTDVEAIAATSSAKATISGADTSTQAVAIEPDAIDRPWTGGFIGRYLLGSEKAAVRVVMITDYQCPDCRRIEDEVMAVVDANEQVSLSVKHFPMCKDCNPHFQKSNMHPNACWAARAAEAAGLLHGNEGFWRMHRWLFENKGTFTKAVLKTGLDELGFDPREFVQTMKSQLTEDLVKSDIHEAIWLGLHYTPMIFINGVELKGVFARDAGPRAIRKVLAANPPPMNHDLDQPDPGAGKCVTDWMAQRKRRLPPDTVSWASGPVDAKVTIDIYADYQEPGSAKCDGAIRKWLEGKPNVRYNFRHFPVDTSCNKVASRTVFEKSCIAHRAVEAAGILGGRDAYWQMHAWVFEHQETLSLEGVVEHAEDMGLGAGMFETTMESPAVQDAIMEDARGAKPTKDTRAMGRILLYRGNIPTVYVNGKVVPRWKLESNVVIDEILEAALEE